MSGSKTALVTGSGRRRVGNVIARVLSERGYRVAIHYHQSEAAATETVEELCADGSIARAFQADLTREAEVARLFADVDSAFGRLDLLVNTAAVWTPTPLTTLTADEIRRQFDVNTLGSLLCCKAAAPIMARQDEGGSIILIGDAALDRPYPGYAAYFASKAALPALTECLAVELAALNPKIRINCIHPGPVLVEPDLPIEARRRAYEGNLLSTKGTPEAIASAVLFLAENDYITGVNLPVDGGRRLVGPDRRPAQ